MLSVMQSSFQMKRLQDMPEPASDALRPPDGTPSSEGGSAHFEIEKGCRSLVCRIGDEQPRAQEDAGRHDTPRAGAAKGNASDVFCLQDIRHSSQVGNSGYL
jgi:hypothetical protein